MKRMTVMKLWFIALLVVSLPLHAAVTAYTTPRPLVGNQTVPDVDINTALLAAVAKNPLVSQLNVSISTQNGVVALQGVVPSEAGAAEYIAVAASVPGVMDVDTSRLTTLDHGALPISLVLSAKVRGALVRGKAFGNLTIDQLPISITFNNGILYLSGVVDSTSQMIYVIKIAQAVPGIPRVISELTVKASSVTLP